MATQSQAPPSDENPPKPGLTQAATENHTQAATENQQDVQADAPKQSSPTSVFVNSEPMREEQVQNAVKFLSHPKVRGSPVVYRRSFLEKKGLTKEEIDEAFRRVPDPPPTVQTGGGNQADGLKTSQGMQTQSPVQPLQPAAAAPTNAISPVAPRYRFHWSHAVLAVGLLAASGAGTAVIIKNAIIPRLKSWIRKVVSEEENDSVKKTDSQPSLAEEAAAAAKAAAAAAADVAKASQEMMNSKNEEKRYFGELMNMLNVQVQEMKSMSNSIQKLEGTKKLEGETNALRRNSLIDQDDHQFNVINSKRPYANGKADYDSRSVRSASPPAAAEPSVAPHPKSYMEIMAMVQRGEKPPNEINDSPPNPNQQLSNPRLAPRAKPWEVGQAQNYSSQVTQSQASSEGVYSNVQDNGINYSSNGDSSVPWWQRRNPRITEIENEDEFKSGSYSTQTTEVPVRRAWVPPQPPPVQMAEAAEAIRRPKPSVQKESSDDDQLEASSAGVTDELQRVTKVSESGGAVEINGGSSGLSSSEIQEAKDEIYG
ncbi:peroxisomal membrane protein PEX14 isoform X2 [Morus notabilis]|uniref:peroxisomal membrane protein PEX14 isoform X2 n=1 Tax=Morus notabilis TaxID=981085 RepID=UPI000CED4284|nr:peroxisomal membrane protein PEX14 isoform X2 [Morus notabilis]